MATVPKFQLDAAVERADYIEEMFVFCFERNLLQLDNFRSITLCVDKRIACEDTQAILFRRLSDGGLKATFVNNDTLNVCTIFISNGEQS